MPITNKKPPSFDDVDALIFYSQKLSLISKDLDILNCLWQDCEDKKEFKTDIAIYHEATCNRRQAEPCKACIDNKAIAKEKRRLKAQFNKTVNKMLLFTPLYPELCYKTVDGFVDIYYKKLIKD